MNSTIIARIETLASREPDRACAIFLINGETVRLSYGQLWETSVKVGRALRSRGCGAGSLVLIVHESHPDMFGAFFGAMLAAAIPAMMPPPSPKQRADIFWRSHRELYGRLDPSLIIASPSALEAYATQLPEFSDRTRGIASLIDEGRGSPVRFPEAAARSIACIQHSSGTTALKKGVALTHDAVLRQIGDYADVLGIDDASVIVSWLPLYHDMGFIACFLLPLCLGIPVVTLNPIEWSARPTTFLDAIEAHGGTHAWMPNFAFEHIRNATKKPEAFDLKSLRAIVNCSEVCRPATMRRFVEHFAVAGLDPSAPRVCYALAENVFAVAQTPLGTFPRVLARGGLPEGSSRVLADALKNNAVMSCGRLLPDVQVKIIAETSDSAGGVQVGEIALRGPTLFSEYHQRPDLTAAAFAEGWYLTRDLGFLHEGELFVIGRMDDMIVSYGRNFLAFELEAVLNELPGVVPGRAVVFAIDGETSGTRELVVLCEPADGEAPRPLARAVRLAVEASAGIMPRHVLIVPAGSLIKSTSGKLSRSANRDAFLAGQYSAN